jgi:hypothetical protein
MHLVLKPYGRFFRTTRCAILGRHSSETAMSKARRTLRPAYGYALAIIVLLGVIGGAATVISNNGKAPLDSQSNRPIR